MEESIITLDEETAYDLLNTLTDMSEKLEEFATTLEDIVTIFKEEAE
jgi:hypothetical protein